MIEFGAILIIAVLLDFLFGEPPAAVHPVVWMGKVIGFLFHPNPARSRAVEFVYGLSAALFVIALFAVAAYFLLVFLQGVNAVFFVIAGAALLKTTFSLRGLRRAAAQVRDLLSAGKLPEARFALRALCKRDAATLSEPKVVSATVESVAENMCDSFVAPLFYFALFGVPGAVAYRVINTLDAMVGYHGDYEYLGKFAARLDDAANFIPARLTGLFITVAAGVRRASLAGAWRVMWRDADKTASPNAGWAMSAMAGALSVRLEKMDHYALGDDGSALTTGKISASLDIILTASIIWCLAVILARAAYLAAA